ncbi:MAG: hypothetical protein LBR13_03170 [Dysgonamonadaceae bacterium]|jgi:hypothetical protein|nr:hypothetical protein [Dysgonamonadaceae bacterium]
MKSIKFILVSSALLIASGSIFACGPYRYSDYTINSVFRIVKPNTGYFDDTYLNGRYLYENDWEDNNIKEWQKIAGMKIDEDDIAEVVYGWDIPALKQIDYLKELKTNNQFLKYLHNKKETEIVEYLILAKRCEQARPQYSKQSDKWWYPSKEDLEVGNELQSVIDEALAYKGKRLKTRYLLQALRAAFSLEKYDFCEELWTKNISKQPQSEAKKMCAGLIGRIYFQKQDYRQAIKYYALTDDYDSFFMCSDKITGNKSLYSRFKMLYAYRPRDSRMAIFLEKICHEAEDCANYKNYQSYSKYYLSNRKTFIEIRDLALKAALNDRFDNPAMWQFAASYLTLLDGDTGLANKYLDEAKNLRGTEFVKRQIETFALQSSIYTAAQCDSLFESLIPEIRELENVKGRPFNKYSREYGGIWTEIYTKPMMWWYPNNASVNGIEKSDMEKITPAWLISKYMQLKEYTKVLLLATASNTVIQHFSSFYGTDIYFWMDILPVENLIEYKNLRDSGGNTGLEKYLLARCTLSDDFLNELIGTKYLREQRFEQAIPYLSAVSETYIKKMNLYDYFHLDTFRKIYKKRKLYKPYPAYKLNYAQRMVALQHKIDSLPAGYNKAQALVDYGVALKRSVQEGESWAITDYFLGGCCDYNDLRDDFPPAWKYKILADAEKCLKQAERNSKSREIAAQCFLARKISYHEDFTEMRDFRQNFAGSNAEKQFKAECDNYASYSLQFQTK